MCRPIDDILEGMSGNHVGVMDLPPQVKYEIVRMCSEHVQEYSRNSQTRKDPDRASGAAEREI